MTRIFSFLLLLNGFQKSNEYLEIKLEMIKVE